MRKKLEVQKQYNKPELKMHGDLRDITKTSQQKGVDGSDTYGGAS